tara:strand:- start:262 stop:435 length:174 start_codon:yes stop_codon:yes gene_type:complete
MELKNSNSVRLELLCVDILNKKVKRSMIKEYAKTYLRLLEIEKKEKEKYERTLEKTI